MEIGPMAKGFLPYSLDQHLLLPDIRAWFADGHLTRFVSRGRSCPLDGRSIGERAATRSRRTMRIGRAERMRYELQCDAGKPLCKTRNAIVEPVFGQLKAVRGLRRFTVRGLENKRAEHLRMALTHHLLKLFRVAPSLGAA